MLGQGQPARADLDGARGETHARLTSGRVARSPVKSRPAKSTFERQDEALELPAQEADPGHVRSRRSRRASTCRMLGRRRQHQGPGDLHPAVRDHDLRRAAAGPVPRHPRPSRRRSPPSPRSIGEVTRDVGGRLDPGRRAGQAQADLRRSVPQHGRGRRGGRHARRHPHASGAPTSRRPTRSSAR